MAEEELVSRRPPPPPHVAIVPSPGIGHLIPLGEFARRLVDDHGAVVTFITLSAGAPSAAQLAYIAALPAAIRSLQLPPVDVSDLPANSIETVISVTVVRSLPALRDALRPLAATAVVVDLFCTPAFDVAEELQVRPYIFYPPNATVLSLFLHLPELDEATAGEYRDLPEPIRLPGCPAFSGADLLDPIQDRSAHNYKWVLRHCRRYRDAAGIFVNTFADLEPSPLTALSSKVPTFPPVHAIGPVIRSSSDGGSGGAEILKWLDEQPVGSVLYVSFGSGGTLTAEQMAELAAGLELSEQRFLWVARSPSETESGATFFTVDSANDPLSHLPEGFLRRTKSCALVVPSWAPQIQVLGHRATAGFLTHCGWNSVLESISKGVPMIAWPLYAEQRMNAVMLSEEIGVALRPAAAAAATVGREEVARVVKALMEGEEGKRVRRQARVLVECGSRAVGPGGSSHDTLAGVVTTWKEIISNNIINNK